MTFPSPQSAIEYLRGKIALFYAQQPVLTERVREVSRLKGEAARAGDQASLGKLIILQSQAKDLLNEQVALEDKLRPFIDALGLRTAQLGAFPLVLIPVAAGVASLLYLHFQKIDAQREALDLVRRGILTPGQAEKLLDTGLGFGNLMGGTMGLILPWAALLIGAYLFIGFRKDTPQ